MRIAVMQPYFLPYIGYFQLINAVERFVVYDDVNYIKQGWISRNRILCNGTEHLFVLPLRGASSFKRINEIEVCHNAAKMLTTIRQSYGKAPCFDDVFALIEQVLRNPEPNLPLFLRDQLKMVCSYLGIDTSLMLSSEISKMQELSGQERVLYICEALGASMYINSIGGRTLYSPDDFASRGIELRFIESRDVRYDQFREPFVPWLSILDVLMFNSVQEIQALLGRYTLL